MPTSPALPSDILTPESLDLLNEALILFVDACPVYLNQRFRDKSGCELRHFRGVEAPTRAGEFGGSDTTTVKLSFVRDDNAHVEALATQREHNRGRARVGLAQVRQLQIRDPSQTEIADASDPAAAHIDSLTGRLGHAFNNCLSGIFGYGYLAKRRVGTEHPAYTNIDAILAMARRARALTAQLIAISRSSGEYAPSYRVDDLLPSMAARLEKDITNGPPVRMELHAPSAYVNIPQADLEQTILDLAVTVAGSTQGEGSLTLSTGTADQNPDQVCVTIQARTGFETSRCPSDLSKPPQQRDAHLALSVARLLAEAWDAQIETDESGDATSYTLRLPCALAS